MAISSPNQIAENSAATPGLWNSIITRLWQNDLSLSGGTVGQSSNTLNPESGNTIFATSSMFSTGDLRSATFYPAAISGTPTWGSTQSVNISGNAATATTATTAGSATTAATVTSATQSAIVTAANLTTIGTLVAGAVPASLVTAGTFGAGSYVITAGLTFGTTLISTTAQATLGALSATQGSWYASTASGATVQGYGTTSDVTLKNRAGTDVLVVGPNLNAVYMTGGAEAASGLITSGAVVGITHNVIRAAAAPTIALRRYNTSYASPSIILTGNTLGSLTWLGFTTGTTTVISGEIDVIATENWVAGSATGSKMVFYVTPNTTTGAVAALTLGQDLSVTIGGALIGVTSLAGTAGLSGFTSFTMTGASAGATVATLTAFDTSTTSLLVFQRSGGAVAGKLAYNNASNRMEFGTTTAHALDIITNGASALTVASGGAVTCATTIATAQPSANGAGLWKLGKLVTAASVASATQYLEVDVDGTVYKVVIN